MSDIASTSEHLEAITRRLLWVNSVQRTRLMVGCPENLVRWVLAQRGIDTNWPEWEA